jgi:hypothetical protein
MIREGTRHPASLVNLRNFFKGKCDYEIMYATNVSGVKIFKTRLTE